MLTHRDRLSAPPLTGRISILIVSAEQRDRESLRNILNHNAWEITQVNTIERALENLTQGETSIILTDRNLPDGKWRDLVGSLNDLQPSPLLLVMSKTTDESLWAEVLNLGGYDVLMKPLVASEVTRVLAMAAHNWRSRKEPSTTANRQFAVTHA